MAAATKSLRRTKTLTDGSAMNKPTKNRKEAEIIKAAAERVSSRFSIFNLRVAQVPGGPSFFLARKS
jgi:hypothetical protein